MRDIDLIWQGFWDARDGDIMANLGAYEELAAVTGKPIDLFLTAWNVTKPPLAMCILHRRKRNRTDDDADDPHHEAARRACRRPQRLHPTRALRHARQGQDAGCQGACGSRRRIESRSAHPDEGRTRAGIRAWWQPRNVGSAPQRLRQAEAAFVASLRNVGAYDRMLADMIQVPLRTRLAVSWTAIVAAETGEAEAKAVHDLNILGDTLDSEESRRHRRADERTGESWRRYRRAAD